MNLIDKIYNYFAPRAALQRLKARALLDDLTTATGSGVEYEGAEISRLAKLFADQNTGPNPTYANDPVTLANRAWHLWRNNPHAKKVARIITGQVVGTGLIPQSLATRDDEPFREFRKRSRSLFNVFSAEADYKGRPGKGGSTFSQLQALALRELMFSGELFVRRRITREGFPFKLEFISAQQLPNEDLSWYQTGLRGNNFIFRGIEYDQDYRRIAYHFWRENPYDKKIPFGAMGIQDLIRIPVNELYHVYCTERIGQERGISWFSAALLKLKNIDDYTYNELVSSAYAACVSMVISTKTPTGNIGLLKGSESNTTSDGNKLVRLAPGAIIRIGQEESAQGFNPGRPSNHIPDFLTAMLRSIATSFPGVKPSSVHGDYTRSSFASEKAADNDCWRETEQVQDLLCGNFCQPIWEDMLDIGVMTGYFDTLDKRSFSRADYFDNKYEYSQASWAGPVAKSVNPVMDEKAITQSIKNGTISIPDAAAAAGYNWQDILDKQKEVMEYALEIGLPEVIVNALLGGTIQINVSKNDSPTNQLDLLGEELDNPQEIEESTAMLDDTTDVAA